MAVIQLPIAIQAVGGFGGGSHTLVAPCPMSLTLPIFLGVPIWAVSSAPALLFLLLCYKQLSGNSFLPIWVFVFFAISSLASIVYFVISYRLGLKYEGAQYTNLLILVTAIIVGSTGYLYLSAMKRPSFSKVVVANWLLSAWLFSYAFPWLGEGL